jgi:hypothetical protein
MATLREELGDKLVERMARGGTYKLAHRGRCLGCGHIARLGAFRYVDGTSDSLRWCPGCGCAERMTLAIIEIPS